MVDIRRYQKLPKRSHEPYSAATWTTGLRSEVGSKGSRPDAAQLPFVAGSPGTEEWRRIHELATTRSGGFAKARLLSK